MSNEKLLRVLTIFDSSEEAEVLINVLRKAGYIVRDIRVEDDEDMETAIEENPLDIILAKQTLPIFNAKDAMRLMIKSGRDIPLVVITPKNQETTAIGVLNMGARDAVASDQADRLKFVVQRELSDLQNRRALRQNEKLLHETEKRTRNLIDSSRDAIAYVHDGAHIYANSAYLKMFGYAELEDIEGMPILDMVSSDQHAKLKEFLRGYAKGQISDDSLDVVGQHTEGKTFNITMEFSSASMEGESCSQIIIRDQAQSKELEKQLNVLSKQDLLTGLFNHTYFIEQADKMISRAVDGQVKGSLLYIMLDKYDDIKNAVGISGRDHVLTDIATLLKEKISNLGLLARFEGAVFTLLLTNADQAQAEKIADGICKLIHNHISEVNQKSVTTTSSIGLTTINETTTNLQDVLSRAEKGALAAEKSGGNQFSIFNPAIEELAEKEQYSVWANKIKVALKENKFQLVYQPIVSLRGEPGAHYEVLVRMKDEDGSEILPAEFLPAAEEMGLINYVDRWVIAHTFMLLTERIKNGASTRFFIKLSSGSLTDLEFLPWITERIKSLRLDADSLVFTLNESTALNYLKQAKVTLQGLRSINCRVGLENFGTEQNMFQSLKHLDVNYLKIDSSLALNLKDSIENQEKLKAIAEEANAKSILAIAAFVEDANSMALLWQSSVAFIQGNFLQQPDSELKYEFDE
ncbi:MAG: EAL domain-containing protein [Gammaproteobacteria bacterium]|nr:EAL domain-containing protein [Gammaproteobacteria bacterium]MCW8988451.1 EAL domain-containing protein [Gammaproteobacteria bacterium]MCW9030384.1 EAL domain-containing protein [Gammaproteobacteria bacterium]